MKSELADDSPSSETLEQELHRWCHRVRREDTAGITSIADIASILHAERDFFANVNTMVQLLMTVPVGTCTCERSMSGLRRIKIWTQTTTSGHLNGPALCFIHKDVDADSASILSEWDKSGHGRITLAFAICLYCLNCTNFGQLILRKIINAVANSGRIVRLKCTKFDFGWGSAPDPAGGAHSAPPGSLAGFKGSYF